MRSRQDEEVACSKRKCAHLLQCLLRGLAYAARRVLHMCTCTSLESHRNGVNLFERQLVSLFERQLVSLFERQFLLSAPARGN